MRQTSDPIQPGKGRFIAAAIVFVLAFALYLFTLAPTVTLVDSGELILAAEKLGVAHPPGFPLYVLLTHVASILPTGSIAVRVHLASALFAALAAAVMTLLVSELMLTGENNVGKKNKKEPDLASMVFLAPAVVAGLLFAFSRTLWAYATIAEVYTLNALLIVTVLWLMFAWRREFLESHATGYRKLYIAALIFGLAMGVHHVTVAFMLPSLGVLVYSTAGLQFFKSKRFLIAAMISVAGLGIYLYLPLAASQSPLFNWSDPRTFDAFWRHISGKQYQAYFGFSASRFNDLVTLFSREFAVIWLPAALAIAIGGLADRYRRDKPMFWALALIILVDIAYCLFNGSAEDKDAYYLPAFISLIIAAGFGVRWIVASGAAERISTFFTPRTAAIALLAIPVVALASNFAYNDRHQFFIAHDYVDNTFASIDPRGMLLTSDWQAYSPSLYVREIEGQRKDVIFIDLKLLKQSWYFGYLDQAYPEMMARSRDKEIAVVEDLRASERDPASYERNPTLKQRVNSRFRDMLLQLVTEQLKTAPLYMTMELADQNSGQDMGVAKLLQEKYELVPQGIVFRFVEKGSPVVVTEPEINTRGLNDGTLKFDDDDVVRKSVIPVYLNMLTNTGTYLGVKGDHGRAVKYFQQTLSIDASFDRANKGLAASQAALQK